MSIHPGRCVAVLIAAPAVSGCGRRHPPKTERTVSDALENAVDGKQPAFATDEGDRGRAVWKEEQRFYRQNGYQLASTDGRRVRGEIDGLLRALRAAEQEGLDPADYHVADLEAARRTFARERAIDLDRRASYAYLRYAWDLTHGTVDPEDVDPQWHDTPAQGLFNRIERDFSHGCVRLDDPDALARYVLRDRPEWTPEKIAAAMQSGTERAVTLKQPPPIYLVYFTAWEEGGALKTVPDVYGLDRRHDAAKGQ